MHKDKNYIKDYFDLLSAKRDKLKKRNKFYHSSIEKYYQYLIPKGSRVLEIGCGTGDLLYSVSPSYGVGIDFSESMVKIANEKYPALKFISQDAESLDLEEKFDYIILSDVIGLLWDVQKVIRNLRKVSDKSTRIIINSYNYLWHSLLSVGEKLKLKTKDPTQNWLSLQDIISLLELEGFQIIKTDRKILLPKYMPVLNYFVNRLFANLPVINHLCLINYIVARPIVEEKINYSASIIIPAKNEKGNIENAIRRIPEFADKIEYIFVEGNSNDGTYEEMHRVKSSYKNKNIKIIKQTGRGKGNAVREGFDISSCDVLMILDADLTTPPEDLPKFYDALSYNRGEFINGCRLIYPMEKEAMRFLNLIANKIFGLIFTFLLGQKLKDTLCGTKVILKKDYEKLKENRKYFGDFDPFGDFDLIFGASKLNLKIVEIPVRYKDREYGSTQISRFRHGWLLFKMSYFAAKKIKFN